MLAQCEEGARLAAGGPVNPVLPAVFEVDVIVAAVAAHSLAFDGMKEQKEEQQAVGREKKADKANDYPEYYHICLSLWDSISDNTITRRMAPRIVAPVIWSGVIYSLFF